MKVDDGSGSFVRVRDIGVGSNPYDIAFGDIDGDGDSDVEGDTVFVSFLL